MFLFTLLLAAGACAAAVVDDAVPNYDKAVRDFTQAKKLVVDLSKPKKDGMVPDWSLPCTGRDYIQLVAFLDGMTTDEQRDIPYDDKYYEVLNKTVPYAWENPQSVFVRLQAALRDVSDATAIIEELVEKYCGTSRSSNDVECNTFVDLEVKKDLRTYQAGAETLKSLGKLVETYVKEPYGSKAHNYDMVAFLLNGKDEIEPLVNYLGHLRSVMKKVY